MSPTRRAFLHATGAAATVGLLAGCIGDGPGTDTTTPAGGSSPTPTESQTPTPGTSPGPPRTKPDDRGSPDPSPTETETPPSDAEAVAWQRAFESAVTAVPVVEGGAVYAASEDGTVRRYAAGDGSETWSTSFSRPVQSLASGEGLLLVIAGTYELGSEQTLHALDAGSGEEQWSFTPTDWWLATLGVRDGTAYVSTADDAVGGSGETLYALAVPGGDELWSAGVGDPREAVVTDDAIYVSSYGRVQALDRDTGDELWNQEVSDEAFGTLGAVDDAVVYAYRAPETDVFSLLVGVDPSTGQERWRFEDWAVTFTATRDGTVYAGGAGVAAIDPADGSTVWADAETPGTVRDPGVTGDRVYAGGETLRAFDRDDGELDWEWTPDPPQAGVSPAGVVSGSVYLDSYRDGDPRNRYKFAVDAASGEGRWAFEDGTGLTDLAVGTDSPGDGVRAVAGGGNGRLYALR